MDTQKSETAGQIEPLTDINNFRLTIKPISKKYEIFWKLYKKQQDCYWRSEHIDFTKDYDDFLTLSSEEQHFIKMVLAFFASSDGIVNFNLRENLLPEIQILEAQIAYAFQMIMENIHGETYSDMLINIVRDPVERNRLLNAIETIESVKKMSDWAFNWIRSKKSLGHIIVAFAIVEGVFFSSSFAAIFWLKKQRGNGKLFMEGFNKSNRYIARDEGLHVAFACALYSFITNRIPEHEAREMMIEANEISNVFVEDAIRCRLMGMNSEAMSQYVNYVSDRLMVMLGYNKIYNVSNPFEFMETIGMLSKDNFFENRPDAYQSAHNEENKESWAFSKVEDF